MKQTNTNTVTAKTPARQARWGDSGLSERYGKLGSGAVCAALIYAGKTAGAKSRKARH
ncbi:MAG: hypothetical protein R3D65_02245 [Zhengella sp.]|uniref:hypothetical protein n=1 Tax=Zhengella sp. TaxID=2282762 RepID=UPI001E0C7C7F|nr:hypothetical protein [Notoacmeibacter sp.]MCC0027970.1 hypothetical protein [Brucellaceae bacterium]